MFTSAVEGLQSFKQKQLQGLSDNPLYIPIQARQTTFSQETPSDLMDSVKSFLSAEDPKKVLLILGEAGYGKSLFFQTLARQRWMQYQDDHAIPIFVSLPCLDQTNRVIEDTLESHGFTPDQVNQLKIEKQFIFILDGYDEIHRLEQIYLNNRWQEWRAKIIISCRAQALYHVEQYESLFTPYQDDVPQYNLLQQLHVAEFSESQIDEYLKRYAILSSQMEMGDVESIFSIPGPPGGIGVDLFLDEKRSADEIKNQPIEGLDSEKIITKAQLESIPGLMQLVKTPFILRIALDALPEVLKDFAEGKNEGITEAKRTELTQAKLYDSFVNKWFLRQEKKLKEAKIIDDSFDPKPMFLEYCYALSLSMLRNNVTSINLNTVNLATKEEWLSLIGDEAELARSACLITRYNQNEFGFMHASFREYFVVRKDSEKIIQKEMLTDEENIRLDTDDPLYDMLLTQNKEYIQRKIDYPECIESSKERYRRIILKSKDDKKFSIAAANLITILNAYGEVFSQEDFSGVRIKGADLSGGIFDHTIFYEADLRDVNFTGAWLRNANLTNAKLEGTIIDEERCIKLDSSSAITAIAYSADGELLAVSDLHCIYLYNARKRQLISKFESAYSIKCLAVGEGILATGLLQNSTVELWDIKNKKFLQTLVGHTETVLSVAFGPNHLLASGSRDKTVRLWEIKSKRYLYTFEGHTASVRKVAFGPNNLLASASTDGTVRLWDVENLSLLHIFDRQKRGICSVAFGFDHLLASGEDNGDVCVMDVKRKKFLNTFSAHEYGVSGVIFSSTFLVSAGDSDGKVKVWDVKEMKHLQTFEGHKGLTITGVACGYDNLITSGGRDDNTVRFWRVRGQPLLQKKSGHKSTVSSVAIGSNNLLASGGLDKEVQVWNMKSGRLIHIFEGHVGAVYSVAFTPNDLLVSGSEDKTVRVWDIKNRRLLKVIENIAKVYCIAISLDNILATGGDDKLVRIWDIKNNKLMQTLVGHTCEVSSVAFCQNELLASGSDNRSFTDQKGEVRVWDLNAGILLWTSEGCNIDFVAFDGSKCLAAAAGREINVWNADDGKLILTLGGYLYDGSRWGHEHTVTTISFGPGNLLASGSTDNTVRLWDIESGQCLIVISDFTRTITSVAWYQDTAGIYLAIGSQDSAVRFWRVKKEENEITAILLWSSHQATLVVSDVSYSQIVGLDSPNSGLLKYLNENLDDMVKEGIVLTEKDKFNDALDIFNRVIKLNSNHISAYYNKGVVLWNLEDDDSALNCFEHVLTLDTMHVRALELKSRIIASTTKNYNEALTLCEKAYKIAPIDSEILRLRGYLYSKLNKLEEALSCYEQIIEIEFSGNDLISENYIFALKCKARILAELNFKAEAVNIYNQLQKLGIDDVSYWRFKGDYFYDTGNFSEAITCFGKVLELSPVDPEDSAYRLKGCALFYIDDYEGALTCFDEMLKLNNDAKYTHCYKGYILLIKNKLEFAKESFESASQGKDVFHLAEFGKGLIHLMCAEVELAEQYFKSAEDALENLEAEEKAEFYFTQGKTFLALNNIERAKLALDNGLKINANHAPLQSEMQKVIEIAKREDSNIIPLSQARFGHSFFSSHASTQGKDVFPTASHRDSDAVDQKDNKQEEKLVLQKFSSVANMPTAMTQAAFFVIPPPTQQHLTESTSLANTDNSKLSSFSNASHA